MLRRPRMSEVRFRTAAIIAVAGVLAATAWGFLTYENLQDRLEALARTDVPGEVTFEVTEPGGRTIFYEDVGAGTFLVQTGQHRDLTSIPVDLTVTGPDGEVATASYELDLRFHHSGRDVTAVATFDAPTAGMYTLTVAGDGSSAARVAVGDVVDVALLANVVGAVLLLVGALLTAGVIMLVALVNRPPTPRETTTSAGPTGRSRS